MNMFAQCITILLFLSLALCRPIFEDTIGYIRLYDGKMTIIRYIDTPANVMESLTLSCRIPIANRYEWLVDAKAGAPYAGSVRLSSQNENFIKPWEYHLPHMKYPNELLLVRCTPRIGLEPLIYFVWVITRLKSGHDIPSHPVICDYPKALCVPKMFDCYNHNGLDYRGKVNRTSNGEICQLWRKQPISDHTKDNMEAMGVHNYCRNFEEKKKKKPWCYVRNGEGVVEDRQREKECAVQRCHDCILWEGWGYFIGYIWSDKTWKFPWYSGRGIQTKYFTRNPSGKNIRSECHYGTSSFWSENVCLASGRVGRRDDRPYDGKPRCLVVKDRTKIAGAGEKADDVFWPNLMWALCIAPQCTVRQVWFLIINPDGMIHYDSNNEEPIEIAIFNGESKRVTFYHFGTNYCVGMEIETDESLEAYLHMLKLICNTTPQVSYIDIMEPTKDINNGVFTVSYRFIEGDPIIDLRDYKVNFKIKVQSPTTMKLSHMKLCPGYQGKTNLLLKGDYKLVANSITWLFSYDEREWKPVYKMPNVFDLSNDGTELVIKKSDKNVTLKVNAATLFSNLTTQQRFLVADLPIITAKASNIEKKLGEEVKLSVKYNIYAKSRWVHGAEVINKKAKRDSPFNLKTTISLSTSEKKDTLTISKLARELVGIYTVDVTKDGCSASKMIYVNLEEE